MPQSTVGVLVCETGRRADQAFESVRPARHVNHFATPGFWFHYRGLTLARNVSRTAT
jgi:hypothetical protein